MSSGSSSNGFRIGLILSIVVFILFIVVLLVSRSPAPFGFNLLDSKVDTIPIIAVEEVQYQNSYEYEKEFVGKVEARQRSALGFELSGLLKAITVHEGDAVKKNEILARLDTKRLRANLKEAKATLNQSIAEAKLASSTFQRNQKALSVNAVSKQELDVAKKENDTAEALVEVNQARVETIEINLEKSILLAPYDGIVTRRFVDVGVVISPGEKIVELQESGPLDIRIGVTTEAAETLKVGEEHNILVNGSKISAKVYAILPVIGENRTVDVIFRASETNPNTRPGDLAKLILNDSIYKRGFWVPLSSLTEGRRGLWTVYIVEKNEDQTFQISRRHVEVYHTDSKRAFVSGSVDDKERIVSDGTQKLVPGLKVKIAVDTNQHE